MPPQLDQVSLFVAHQGFRHHLEMHKKREIPEEMEYFLDLPNLSYII